MATFPGAYYVCEYGADACDEGYESSVECIFPDPAGLPNFNSGSCPDPDCVEARLENLETCTAETDDAAGLTPAPTTQKPTPRPTPYPTTLKPTDLRTIGICVDDPDWHFGSSPHKDCGFISRFEWEDGSLDTGKGRLHFCAKKGYGMDQETKTLGYEACPVACGLCDAGEEDSSSWYATGKPKNDCDWIGEKPDARCGKKDADTKVEAWYVRAPSATADDAIRVGTPARRPAPATRTTTRPRRASRTFTTTSRTTSTADPKPARAPGPATARRRTSSPATSRRRRALSMIWNTGTLPAT